jgi:hypothetical protein
LHAPGLLVWILLGFVPGVGTLTAARDGYYSFEVREWGAFLLNLLGLIPFVKGFANIADLALLHRLRHTAHIGHRLAHAARHQQALRQGRHGAHAVQRSVTTAGGSAHAGGAVVLLMNHANVPRQNAWAWPAALLALITFVASPVLLAGTLFTLGGALLLNESAPLQVLIATGVAAVWSAFVLLLAIRARRVARRMRGRRFARPGIATTAFWLALVGLLFTASAMGTALFLTVSGA